MDGPGKEAKEDQEGKEGYMRHVHNIFPLDRDAILCVADFQLSVPVTKPKSEAWPKKG